MKKNSLTKIWIPRRIHLELKLRLEREDLVEFKWEEKNLLLNHKLLTLNGVSILIEKISISLSLKNLFPSMSLNFIKLLLYILIDFYKLIFNVVLF